MDTLLKTQVLEPTLSAAQAQRKVWDVVVIGAGPAGSLAARQLARRGVSTLLVDRAQFPRHKVCGSCLSAAGLRELEQVGLGHLPEAVGAPGLSYLSLHAGRRSARIPLPGGVAISRSALDAMLIQEAIRRGADFLPQSSAHLDGIDGDLRGVYLRGSDRLLRVRARLVLVADGLGGRALMGERGFGRTHAAQSRIGAGVMCPEAPDAYAPGTIHMACGRGGYVGLVRVETGGLDVAGAFDADFVRACGGPGPAAVRTLHEAGLPPVARMSQENWQGTPWLTSRPVRIAGERLFVIGDAAGYVEPFTGEGMTWALASARAVTNLAFEAVERWDAEHVATWGDTYRGQIVARQLPCRWLAQGLRRPWLTRLAITALNRWPQAAGPLVSYINRPFSAS